MKNLYIAILIVFLSLNAQALFEVKDSSDNTVLEVSQDGLRIFNMGDTLMVISSTEIKAFIDDSAKDRALSRSFSVTTSTTGKSDSKMFEIAASNGAIFYNPTDNTDRILSIDKSSIIANVNPTEGRDFVINDEVSGKGSGNLMKISNKSAFETVNDSTMLWYKEKNAFRIGYVLITDPGNVGQGSFASGYQSQALGKFSSAIGYKSSAENTNAFASGNEATASGANSTSIGYKTQATNTNAFASGTQCLASGVNSFAFGCEVLSSQLNSFAIGHQAEASGSNSFAAGNQTEASGPNSTALGMFCRATNTNSIALGSGLTISSGTGATAIGSTAQAIGSYSTSIGT
ncbi:MAG: hypothetical protein KAS62_02905, partial [Candidatus Delongbacteria bacterium]|nr:hypothetical protein [Candidatus Delongbacteria bacterium]